MQTCTIKIEGNILAKGDNIKPKHEDFELISLGGHILDDQGINVTYAKIDLKFNCLREFILDLDDKQFCIDRSQIDAYNNFLQNIDNILIKLQAFSNHESGDELQMNGVLRFHIKTESDNEFLSGLYQAKIESFELNSLADLENFLSFARSNSPKLKPEFRVYSFGSLEESDHEMPTSSQHLKLKQF